MKKILYGIIIFIVVISILVIGFALWPTSTRKLEASQAEINTPEMIKKGAYLAILGDCAACHSPEGTKKPFRGGVAIQSPIGTMYATNITPDVKTGIGTYSLNDFSRAVRSGIRNNGQTLYPAMPYPSFSRLSDDDIKALYAYFRYGIVPVSQANKIDTIPWPLSIRWPVAIWRKLYAPAAHPFDGGKYHDQQVTRGAYIVQGLGHCGTCHTPRADTLQEKGLDETSAYYLTGGGIIDGWVALSLRDNTFGLKSWSADEIVSTLKTGRNLKGVIIGDPMNSFVARSGKNWNDEDLRSAAAYLKTLKAQPVPAKANVPASANNTVIAAGSSLYRQNCSACHGPTGKGIPGIFPPLAANPTVLSANPQSVIRIIGEGYTVPLIDKSMPPLQMIPFKDRLKDKDIAEIATFIRSSWGNSAENVIEDMVKKIRTEFWAPQ